MADNPGDYGCYTVPDYIPIVGGNEYCVSDLLDGNGGNGNGKKTNGLVKNGLPTNGNGQRGPWAPGHGSMIDGCPQTLPVTYTQRAVAPRGYVVVIDPQSGQKVAMNKKVARACGLWKPARKPPIKASDYRCLTRANAVVKKLDRVVKMSNQVTGKNKLTRSKPTMTRKVETSCQC